MITNIAQLKLWFKSGLKPLEAQYHAWLDSYWHKSENIPMTNITNLETTLQQFVTQNQITNITNALIPLTLNQIQNVTPSLGYGKLLEVIVIETSATTDIEIIYNNTILVAEQINQTTVFSVDIYLEAVNSITINSSIVVNAKIYTR
jgi:hypothetical protein